MTKVNTSTVNLETQTLRNEIVERVKEADMEQCQYKRACLLSLNSDYRLGSFIEFATSEYNDHEIDVSMETVGLLLDSVSWQPKHMAKTYAALQQLACMKLYSMGIARIRYQLQRLWRDELAAGLTHSLLHSNHVENTEFMSVFEIVTSNHEARVINFDNAYLIAAKQQGGWVGSGGLADNLAITFETEQLAPESGMWTTLDTRYLDVTLDGETVGVKEDRSHFSSPEDGQRPKHVWMAYRNIDEFKHEVTEHWIESEINQCRFKVLKLVADHLSKHYG